MGLCGAGTGSESVGDGLAGSQSCSGAWGRGARVWGASFSPPLKGTMYLPLGRETLWLGLGSALGSCEGQGLWQGLGNALFNGLRVLSPETSAGNTDLGVLCLASVIFEA